MSLQFRNQEVAEKYEATRETDIKKFCTGYHGLLSKIDLKGAEYLVKVKDPDIKEKKIAAKPASTK
jgi:hypothetical protein